MVKHLVVNNLEEVEHPNISITARSKKLYFSHLFPDCKNKRKLIKMYNREILDIGCGYNPLFDESFINYVLENENLNAKITGMDIIDMKMPNYVNKSIYDFKRR